MQYTIVRDMLGGGGGAVRPMRLAALPKSETAYIFASFPRSRFSIERYCISVRQVATIKKTLIDRLLCPAPLPNLNLPLPRCNLLHKARSGKQVQQTLVQVPLCPDISCLSPDGCLERRLLIFLGRFIVFEQTF